MQKRHQNYNQYFEEQVISTKKYIIPYIEGLKPLTASTFVMEVGCGEGGNLLPFCELGCQCTGIDIDTPKIEVGRQRLSQYNVQFFCQDIYTLQPADNLQFDIIFLKDVIEHIHNQDKFIGFIRQFLKPDGIIFFAFPPFRMPFGGHQQILENKFLSKLPYFHLLPKSLYAAVLKASKLIPAGVEHMLDIKKTGISIHRFQKIAKKNHFFIKKDTHWFINPNYETKFSLKPRQLPLLLRFPFLKDFYTTCYWCIIQPQNTAKV
ncbi:MAG: class I SAM-dependent methyltransferase [Bacteroidales bacterium]|jgi:2-polyprenyl-3-methyl-5-hydroxy-6-metoxy-1,4-benzoquinol methylase|nr:class I SAM-dependent methyltransferase [Bacteroidales bacterium]